MDSVLRLTQWFIYALSAMIWIGALAFAGFRIHQMSTLPSIGAEVLEAKTQPYISRSYARDDATGFSYETRSRMYAASATVRYVYQGRQYTAQASHDVGASFQWFQDRLTRQWKPGAWIRVHIDPAKPEQPLAGLGFNLNTFAPAIGLVIFGLVLMGAGYGVGRLPTVLSRFHQALPGPK